MKENCRVEPCTRLGMLVSKWQPCCEARRFMSGDWSIYSASAEPGVESRVNFSPSSFCKLLEFFDRGKTS